MSEHTPTPWYWTKVIERNFDGSGGDAWPIYKKDGRYAHPATANNESDAAFIVRAVNSHDALVAALELFERQWNACGPNSDFGRHFGNVRDVVRAALASAREG